METSRVERKSLGQRENLSSYDPAACTGKYGQHSYNMILWYVILDR